ncbi:hypothetical protein JTL66_35655, partial [Pseudomonas aeruginosa]|nr:hypothetical protein [Pseudomonas aeruginosa]
PSACMKFPKSAKNLVVKNPPTPQARCHQQPKTMNDPKEAPSASIAPLIWKNEKPRQIKANPASTQLPHCPSSKRGAYGFEKSMLENRGDSGYGET